MSLRYLMIASLLGLTAAVAGCGGVLTGTVVHDADGKAVCCAQIEVRDVADTSQLLAKGRTNLFGDFIITDVPTETDLSVLISKETNRGSFAETCPARIDESGSTSLGLFRCGAKDSAPVK